jgi:hypothetical protein
VYSWWYRVKKRIQEGKTGAAKKPPMYLHMQIAGGASWLHNIKCQHARFISAGQEVSENGYISISGTLITEKRNSKDEAKADMAAWSRIEYV